MVALWGNFVRHDNPSISASIAAGAASSQDAGDGQITDWPVYTNANPIQINLNQTGGTEVIIPDFIDAKNISVPEFVGPGLTNKFDAVNAFTWEGGRGIRCDFWRSMGVIVPE